MQEKVLTDNVSETLKVKWDGERYAIIVQKEIDKGYGFGSTIGYSCVLLNPREMSDLMSWVKEIENG